MRREAAVLSIFPPTFVFGGDTDRPYTEEDIPAPVNYYGYTKLEGEKRIAAVCKDYAIVRVVVVYGASLPGQHGNVLQLVANRLRNNEEVFVVSGPMAYAHLRGRRVARSGEADKSPAKRHLPPLWQRVPDHCRHRLSGSGRIGTESLAHPSRHYEGDE